MLPFANLSDSADEYFSDGLTEDLIHALSLQSFYRVLSRSSTFSFKGKSLSTRLIAREIDATYLIQGSVRRAGSKIRVTAELIAAGERRAIMDRSIRQGHRRSVRDAGRTHHESVRAHWRRKSIARKHPLPTRSTSTDLTAWDRFLRGLSHYYQPTKPDFEASIALFREAIALDPGACNRARLSRHHHGAGRAIWMDQEHARIVDRGDEPRRKAAFGLIRVRHSHFRFCPICTRWKEITRPPWRPRKKAVELNPYDMGARGVLGLCHLVIGEHQQAIELFSTAVQRGNSDPRYQWAALLAFSHYLLGQYDASLSWSREALYLNPNHLQVLAVRAAALAQSGRAEEAAKATEALAHLLPGPDRRTAPAEFPLEKSGRHRPLS